MAFMKSESMDVKIMKEHSQLKKTHNPTLNPTKKVNGAYLKQKEFHLLIHRNNLNQINCNCIQYENQRKRIIFLILLRAHNFGLVEKF